MSFGQLRVVCPLSHAIVNYIWNTSQSHEGWHDICVVIGQICFALILSTCWCSDTVRMCFIVNFQNLYFIFIQHIQHISFNQHVLDTSAQYLIAHSYTGFNLWVIKSKRRYTQKSQSKVGTSVISAIMMIMIVVNQRIIEIWFIVTKRNGTQ
mgnify:FL=1